MTTIATDGKTMAGDGYSYVNGTRATDATVKVERLRDASLYGACGNHGDGVKHRQWLEAQIGGSIVGDCPKLDDGFGFILLRTDGTILQGGSDGIGCEIDAPFAIGSGMDYALGAMDAGASPKRAIEIASGRDKSTGGVITVLEVTPKAKLEAA